MTSLARTLGPISIWGLGVGYVISGMYFGWNLGLPVGGVLGLGLATVAVTVFYVAFVLGYTELACALPRAGGVFVYAGRAFGPNLGFVAGIVQILEYTLAPAACSFAIGAYINQAIPTLPIHAVAAFAYLVFTAINIWGVSLTVRFEIVMTVLAVIELCVFGVVVLPHFSWARFAEDPLPHGVGGAFAALPFAMWFYLGIEGMANIAEETKDAGRDLPRGFLAAMATLVALTAITLFGAVGAAGWHGVVYPDPGNTAVTSDSPLPLAIAHVVSRDSPYFLLLVGVGLVGLIASFHGTLVASSRALMELGRARYLPAALGQVHASRRTPMVALLVNMGIGLAAIAVGRTDEIIVFSVFGALSLYLFASASLLRLRRVEPALARPYRTPFYPAPPLVAIGLGLICLGAMVYSHPILALVYAGVVGAAWLGFVRFPWSAAARSSRAEATGSCVRRRPPIGRLELWRGKRHLERTMEALVRSLADTMSLSSLLELLRDEVGAFTLVDHWKQGEFHHDVVVRCGDARVLVVATNCNGGVKEVLLFDEVPERYALWHWRCPNVADFSGELPTIVARATTSHFFDPCDLLADDARSELLPEHRVRQKGGGWEPAPSACGTREKS